MMIDVEEELPPMSVQGEIQDKVGNRSSRRKPRPRLPGHRSALVPAHRSSMRTWGEGMRLTASLFRALILC